MSGSIIPPSYFYLLSVCDNLSQLFSIAMVLSLFLMLGLGIAYLVISTDAWNEEEDQTCKRLLRMMKRVLFLLPFFAVGAVFVPSKTTLLSMMVAKIATYENAELTVDAIKEAVDYIVAAIASLK